MQVLCFHSSPLASSLIWHSTGINEKYVFMSSLHIHLTQSIALKLNKSVVFAFDMIVYSIMLLLMASIFNKVLPFSVPGWPDGIEQF